VRRKLTFQLFAIGKRPLRQTVFAATVLDFSELGAQNPGRTAGFYL
jgi:hypothetical protein